MLFLFTTPGMLFPAANIKRAPDKSCHFPTHLLSKYNHRASHPTFHPYILTLQNKNNIILKTKCKALCFRIPIFACHI